MEVNFPIALGLVKDKDFSWTSPHHPHQLWRGRWRPVKLSNCLLAPECLCLVVSVPLLPGQLSWINFRHKFLEYQQVVIFSFRDQLVFSVKGDRTNTLGYAGRGRGGCHSSVLTDTLASYIKLSAHMWQSMAVYVVPGDTDSLLYIGPLDKMPCGEGRVRRRIFVYLGFCFNILICIFSRKHL